jgi:hypothetical protein
MALVGDDEVERLRDIIRQLPHQVVCTEKCADLMHSHAVVAALALREPWAAPGFSHGPALTDRHDFGLHNMAAVVHALSVHRGRHCEAAGLGSSHMRYVSWDLQQIHSSLHAQRAGFAAAEDRLMNDSRWLLT